MVELRAMPAERIQKILAQVGMTSRRKAEEWIVQGEVTVNGKVAQLGEKAEWGKDAIKVRGKLVHHGLAQEPTYLLFHKPKGVICAFSDPQSRPHLGDFLDSLKVRLFSVGRLDFNGEGVLLVTNNGTLNEAIQKRDDIARTYRVKVKGHPDAQMLASLEKGAKMEVRPGDIKKKLFVPHSVRYKQELDNKSWIEIVVLGAGNFDVKAYFEIKGFLVERVVRSSFGHLKLKELAPGQYRTLDEAQVRVLLDQPELGLKADGRTAVVREVTEKRPIPSLIRTKPTSPSHIKIKPVTRIKPVSPGSRVSRELKHTPKRGSSNRYPRPLA